MPSGDLPLISWRGRRNRKDCLCCPCPCECCQHFYGVKIFFSVHIGLCGQPCVFCAHLHLWDTSFAGWRHLQMGKLANRLVRRNSLGLQAHWIQHKSWHNAFQNHLCSSLEECISAFMGNLRQKLTAGGYKSLQTEVSKEGVSDLLWLWSRATSDLWKQIKHGPFPVKTLNVNRKIKKKGKTSSQNLGKCSIIFSKSELCAHIHLLHM